MSEPMPDPLAYTGYLAWQLAHVLGARVEKALRPLDLTLAQHNALRHVAWTPDISSAEIARRTGITPQSMGAAVNTLVDRGLLERREHPSNRRTVLLTITEQGERLVEQAQEAVGQVDAEALEPLASDERAAVNSLLRRMLAAVNPEAVPSPESMRGPVQPRHRE